MDEIINCEVACEVEVVTSTDIEAIEDVEMNIDAGDASTSLTTAEIQIKFNLINKCVEAMELESTLAAHFLQSDIIKNIVYAEDALLTTATSGYFDDIFYISVMKQKDDSETHYVARFFENGGFNSAHISFVQNWIKEKFSLAEILPYQVYTQQDVTKAKFRAGNLYASMRRKPGATEKKNVIRNIKGNKKSWYSALSNVDKKMKEGNLECVFFFALAMHNNQKFDESSDFERQHLISSNSTLATNIYEQLKAYRRNGESVLPEFDATGDWSMEKQFFYISSLPNLHRWNWSGVNEKEFKYEQRFSVSCRFYPGSPRNRIIQACCFRDSPEEIVEAIFNNISGSHCTIPYPERKKRGGNSYKKRRSKGLYHQKPNTPLDVVDDEVFLENLAPMHDKLFEYFVSELFRHGSLFWRVRGERKQVVMMNGYDCNTGNFLKFDYVHVTAIRSEHQFQPHLQCDCKTFNTARNCDNLVRCCHVRLLNDLLKLEAGMRDIQVLNYINKSVFEESLKKSDMEVIQVGAKSGIERYSVVFGDCAEFVTISEVSGTSRFVAQCHSSLCKAKQTNKRLVLNLGSEGEICDHLKIFRDRNQWTSKENPHINTEASALPNEKWEDVFDVSTGLWTFGKGSPSTQTVPSEEYSPALESSIQCRYQINVFDASTFPTFSPDADGTCQCQAGWVSELMPDGHLIKVSPTMLYLDRGAVSCDVYQRLCLNKTCKKYWSGEKEHIFRSSSQICCGYEIGWQFVRSVNYGKQTFSGFCDMMSGKYKEGNLTSKSFMSTKSFISWWFSWASHMKIDFRESCCGCGEYCPVLACDGTKIGLGFKQAFVSPIEKPIADETQETPMKRFDRSFIRSSAEPKVIKDVKIQLRELCSELSSINFLRTESFVAKVQNLSAYLDDSCKPFFLKICCNETNQNIRISAATLFKILFTDVSLDTVLPYCYCNHFEQFLESCVNGECSQDDFLQEVDRLKKYSPEISALLDFSYPSNLTVEVVTFLQGICHRVNLIHQVDVIPDPVVRISGTYNPPKFGRAYYFTNHGEQVRQVRSFTIDSKKKGDKIYDEAPGNGCSKYYPKISKKGVTFLFLWFCPYHGHCLGFHIIPQSEGRKDVMASLYTYAETAPREIFYDFACSLSEYMKNRESGFFATTRYFHDIFHGYGHKCPPVFRSDRLIGLEGINTSICEQFNAFLQRIKASGKLMSQTHFVFYVQFFIRQWNMKMKNNYLKKKRVGDMTVGCRLQSL